eukprot:CAMPEP_0182862094 /NCGR_PEP_ID=MMETSP0034_2-20130328/5865_1 /TAXON_ID=156128 /ORGANISM="Nephroselmis pyriformis, Strain CCMP717" /LENGTH=206 /DNA_ID=CAMNT_0024994103 /DNA_START=60 /DNA_END=680 /DNA_ORIENTATION=-
MTLNPNFKWAERKDKVYVTVDVVDCDKPELSITEKTLSFKGTDGEGKVYELKVDFFKDVVPDECVKAVNKRNIVFVLHKAEEGYWERLLPTGVKMNNCKVDFDKWVDEDEDTGAAPDLGGMDFSGMGGGGMPGMGGMGGMGGMEGLMGGMGGMGGGMGGMDMEALMAQMKAGGMGGMGGMGGDEGDDGDSDDGDMPELEDEPGTSS